MESPPSTKETKDDAAVESGHGAREPGLVLVFASGLPTLRTLPLSRGAALLGRDDAGGAPLRDERVSRKHARVSFGRDHFVVTDLDSRNGTFVDGRRIRGATSVRAATTLRLGGALFVFSRDVGAFDDWTVERAPCVVAGPLLGAALARIERAARSGASVLVTGETGTGKEIAARAFHDAGPCPTGPFVAVNCAAIPPGLAERLVFGARKGAFSGAVANAVGHLQSAHRGTLFLDEVGKLDLEVQAKLLRVLETKVVVPLGASEGRAVDVRVCAATNRDLRAAVEAGDFRADLYYRIGRPEVTLPPLRERPEEVPWLVAGELSRAGSALGVDARVLEACMLRPFPGNVRELLAEVRHAVGEAHAAGAAVLLAEHLGRDAGRDLGEDAPQTPGVPTREAIEAALAEHGGNLSAAARALRVHRTQLYRYTRRYGIVVTRVADD